MLLKRIAAAAASNQPPNIILVLADDLGIGDLGCYGQQQIATPRLDALAAGGLRFTSAYSACPVCAPARRSLLTGRHIGRTGDIYNEAQLQAGEWTVTKSLNDSGYKVGAFGKWAVGDPGTTGLPWLHGVDKFSGELNQLLAHASYPHHAWDNDKLWIFNDNAACKKYSYLPNKVKDKARSFVGNAGNQPFFAYCPFSLPHANNEANTIEIPWLLGYETNGWPEIEQRYAAAVTLLDRFVGQLVDSAPPNTLIIFTADNGAHSAVGHDVGFFGSTGGRRGYKGWLYEGGIQVPMLMYWPGVIAPGVVDDLVWLPDLAVTLAGLAGGALPPVADGVDLSPLWSNGALPDRTLYWRFDDNNNWIHGEHQEAARRGQWKTVRRNGGAVELYDLANDAAEAANAAAQQPQVAAELTAVMDGWL